MNPTIDLKQALEIAKKFVVTQGDYVAEHWHDNFKSEIHEDGVDVTTEFDLKVEKEFVELVKANFPDCGFKGEETEGFGSDKEYIWVIDPIDGTKFFAKGIPLWGVTVSLLRNDVPVVGIVYNPISKDLYEAIEGGGAFMNGTPLTISTETDPKKMQVVVDLTTWKYDWDKLQDQLSTSVATLMRTFYRVKMLGHGAFSISWVAQGFFGAYINQYSHADKFIDLAGGLLIAKEAGASYERIPLGNKMEQIIVGSPEVINQIKEIIKLA